MGATRAPMVEEVSRYPRKEDAYADKRKKKEKERKTEGSIYVPGFLTSALQSTALAATSMRTLNSTPSTRQAPLESI